jgi:hypothetical protein
MSLPQDEVSSLKYSGLHLSTAGRLGVNSLPGVVQAPGLQESNVVMDERWCPADPVAESPTVLQSNLPQSTTDGEGGRAAKALVETRGSSGLDGARAPNNKNLGWLKEGGLRR